MLDVLFWLLGAVALVTLIVGSVLVLGFFSETLHRKNRTFAPGKLFDVEGRKLHLLCLGEGEPTIILEAGGGSSSITSRYLQEELARFSRVCAYDRAGYGFSEAVVNRRTFDDIAADLEQLLQAAKIPPPYILIGESMGGLMVRRFVARNRDKVAGVVLLDSAEELHVFERENMLRKMRASARISSHLARFGLIRFIASLFPHRVGIPTTLSQERTRELADDISREENFDTAANEISAYFNVDESMRQSGGFGDLGDIPLVVVTHGIPFHGQQAFLEDGWIEAQERLTTLSSKSKLVVAENSGHAISLEQPDFVLQTILELLEKSRSQDTGHGA